MTKRKTVKTIVGTLLGAVIAAAVVFLALFLQFWFSTTNDIEAACLDESQTGATNFYITGDGDLEHYLFAVAQDGDDTKGQELLVFYEQPFAWVKYTKRYTLDVLVAGQPPQEAADIFRFIPNGESHGRIVFYSNNKVGADRGTYTAAFNENGKDYTVTVDYSFSPEQPFICVSAPVNGLDDLKSAEFTSGGQSVYTYIDNGYTE